MDSTSLYVKTAFLQGHRLDRDVFIKPPKEAACQQTVIWKLLKPVYGLQDASLRWFARVCEELKKIGFTACPFEPTLFIFVKDGQLLGLVSFHFDDFLFIGSEYFSQTATCKLKNTFTIGKFFKCPLNFTGLFIERHIEDSN